MTPQAPADPCPASWTCADVGNPNPPGRHHLGRSGQLHPGRHRAPASDRQLDSFHYAYQPVSGNQTLSAQVVTQAGSPTAAQEGIMMRANAGPTSPYYS